MPYQAMKAGLGVGLVILGWFYTERVSVFLEFCMGHSVDDFAVQ